MHYKANTKSGLFWILLVHLLILITGTAHAAAPLADAGADRT